MVSKVKFTAGRVKGFHCPDGKTQAFLWDSGQPGLLLRATKGGAKSYAFETRLHGKTLRLTIGDVRTWSIGKAQIEAARLKSLTDQRIDPRIVIEEQKAATAAKSEELKQQQIVESATVQDAWDDYITERSASVRDGKPDWAKETLQTHRDMIKAGGLERKSGRRPGDPELTRPGILHQLMGMRLIDLTSQVVAAWLAKEVIRTPTMAANAFRYLRAFVNWCIKSKKYSAATNADACTTDDVKRKVPKSKAKKNDSLRRAQLKPWFEAVQKISNPVISAYLQTVLLTGPRKNEMAALRWEDVDFQWKSMKLHDKVDGERTIPLTPYVESLLLNLRRRNETPPVIELDKYIHPGRAKITAEKIAEWEPSPWVFSSPTAASGRLASPGKRHDEALKQAGLHTVSLHGLRKSFSSLAEWVEVPAGVIAQIMGHKPSAIAEKHYIQRELDLLYMWHAKVEAWILNEAGIEFKQTKQAPPELSLVSNNNLHAEINKFDIDI
jgi:integrase